MTAAPAQAPRLQRLGIGWSINQLTGWGVHGVHLALEGLRTATCGPVPLVPPSPETIVSPYERAVLSSLVGDYETFGALRAQNPGRMLACPFPVLHALGNNLQEPDATRTVRGQPDAAVAVFESTNVSRQRIALARSFDVVCTVSKWIAQFLRSCGLGDVRTVHQGVDRSVFHPGPRSGLWAGRFVVFSGGKLEFRKGQDVVVAAFRAFRERHPEALLLAAWQWAATGYQPSETAGFLSSGHVDALPPAHGGRPSIAAWLRQNGVPPDSFVDLAPFPNPLFAQVVREADVALFPNRCEGGTNMVAMEALACGVPCILSANTGHLDVIREDNCFALRTQGHVTPPQPHVGVEQWGESSADEALEALELAYRDRDEARRRGTRGAEFMQDWTWPRHAGELFQTLGIRSRVAATPR